MKTLMLTLLFSVYLIVGGLIWCWLEKGNTATVGRLIFGFLILATTWPIFLLFCAISYFCSKKITLPCIGILLVAMSAGAQTNSIFVQQDHEPGYMWEGSKAGWHPEYPGSPWHPGVCYAGHINGDENEPDKANVDFAVEISTNTYRATNIVISADYKGTVQVGTNVYYLREGDLVPTAWKDYSDEVFHLVYDVPAITNAVYDDGTNMSVSQQWTTNWIGHPVLNDNDKYTPTDYWLPNHEFGLRSDGVVVWRESK